MDIDQFDQEPLLIEYLSKHLASGRLALILGAGISRSFGLPSWEGLLERMFASKGQTPPVDLALELQAEDFRRRHCRNNQQAFLEAVRSALYDGINVSFEDLRRNDSLAAIGALIMASQRGNISQVITFNYDDLLERYLEYHGFVSASIRGERYWGTGVDVTVFHPHGFLPTPPSHEFSEDIVFDQLSYDRVTGDEGKLWRQVVVTILRTHVCLFLGLSGRDRNLSSLLARAKDTHVCREDFWGVVFSDSPTDPMAGFWEERGVYCKVVADYAKALPSFLFAICQAAARTRA